MKYKCLGPFKFENKTYNYNDVFETNKELDLPGVLVVLDNTKEKVEEKEEKKEEKKVEKKPTPKKKG